MFIALEIRRELSGWSQIRRGYMKIFLIIFLCLSLCGCARTMYLKDLNSANIYLRVYQGYPPTKVLTFGNKDIAAKDVDKRIEEYLNKHPEVEKDIAEKMRIYKVCIGMTKEQVLILKEPDEIKYDKKNNQETWIFGSMMNYGNMVKVVLKNDIVAYIDWKFQDYPWPDYVSKEEYLEHLNLK